MALGLSQGEILKKDEDTVDADQQTEMARTSIFSEVLSSELESELEVPEELDSSSDEESVDESEDDDSSELESKNPLVVKTHKTEKKGNNTTRIHKVRVAAELR